MFAKHPAVWKSLQQRNGYLYPGTVRYDPAERRNKRRHSKSKGQLDKASPAGYPDKDQTNPGRQSDDTINGLIRIIHRRIARNAGFNIGHRQRRL